MTHQLTPEHATAYDIAQLGRRVTNDGFAAHEAEVRALVRFVEQCDLQPVAAQVLGDRTAPSTARGRALGKICQHWNDIVGAQRDCDFSTRFHKLLDQWNRHESHRDAGDLAGLWRSRAELDELRLGTTQARNRLNSPA